MRSYVYLAAPYSKLLYADASETLKDRRYQQVTKFAVELMSAGLHVYSPITYGHGLVQYANSKGKKGFGEDYWYEHGLRMLRNASMLVVYQLPDWDKSDGVKLEIDAAKSMGIPIFYAEFKDVK